MITYCKKVQRHVFAMNSEELKTFAELIFLLRNTPPPIGFNRRPLTQKQKEIIEHIFERISYPDDYGKSINERNNQ